MNWTILPTALFGMALFTTAWLSGEEKTLEPGFVALFDGKSLAGWEGNEKIFRVEKGVIVAGSLQEKIAHNEFLCTTKEFKDFELRLEAKLVGEGKNAGVQFRSARIPDHFEVIGYQCDMGHTPERTIWGSLYDESRRKRFLAQGEDAAIAKALKPDGFNALTIRCEGPHVQIWVNDVKTVNYTEQEKGIAEKGVIALQIHGGLPAEASYRNIRIREIEATALQHTTEALESVKKAVESGKAQLVDVREQSEWDQGHLAAAILLPKSKLVKGSEFEQLVKKLDKSKPVYTHCGAGGRALQCGELLKKEGFDVRPLKAGYRKLLEAGFEEGK
jgi:rhodanese-related sulfurtransferase